MAQPKRAPLAYFFVGFVLCAGLGGLAVVIGQDDGLGVFALVGWPLVVVGGVLGQIFVIAAGVEVGVRNSRF